MKFLHVSKTDDDPLTKDTFIKPRIHAKGGFATHDFNMDGALFLSQAYDNGDSDWLAFRRWLQTNIRPPRHRYNKKGELIHTYTYEDENKDDEWLNSKHLYYFDIDFEKHKIYVINTPEELRDFFVKYSVIVQKPKMYFPDSYYKKIPNVEERYKMYKINQILVAFLSSLPPATRALLDNMLAVNQVKDSRNRRNMPLIKLRNNEVKIPKKGITFEFLIDIVRTIEHNDSIVGDFSDLYTWTYIRGIDFPKMVKDGYNGLYYSRSLFKPNTEPYDTNEQHMCNYVGRIDIGEFPDIIGDTSGEDLKEMKGSIEYYIKWLGSDSLMLWNWIFD